MINYTLLALLALQTGFDLGHKSYRVRERAAIVLQQLPDEVFPLVLKARPNDAEVIDRVYKEQVNRWIRSLPAQAKEKAKWLIQFVQKNQIPPEEIEHYSLHWSYMVARELEIEAHAQELPLHRSEQWTGMIEQAENPSSVASIPIHQIFMESKEYLRSFLWGLNSYYNGLYPTPIGLRIMPRLLPNLGAIDES